MQKIHASIKINAPREKVWQIMLGEKTYLDWASAFMPGSKFVGSWEKDSKIQFVSVDEKGIPSGMTSKIVENKPGEFVSINHLGIVANGIEDTTSDEAKKWVGFENYTFKDVDGQTELSVELDLPEDFVEVMNEGWQKALNRLKEICEQGAPKVN
jgi:hypothetical protein